MRLYNPRGLGGVMANIDCQFDRIWNHPGDKALGTFYFGVAEVGRLILNVDWSAGLSTMEKAGWVPEFLSLCFLTVGTR